MLGSDWRPDAHYVVIFGSPWRKRRAFVMAARMLVTILGGRL